MATMEDLRKYGFAMVKGLFSQSDLTLMDNASALFEGHPQDKGGERNIFRKAPQLLGVFKQESVLDFVREILGPRIGVSEGIYLNKKDDANWLVSWHQDLFVSVKEKIQAEGFHAWTTKQGAPYVQPPTEVLEQSLWLRLNLDANDSDNGCLRVAPGSHLLGKVPSGAITSAVHECGETALPCERGDAILFKPLLLHASSKSANPSQRRVFQVLFSGFAFENGIGWPY
jgi:ectoine hydroxylase-related dioxygenase (phytanoyl-CoA dioxygenase family)